MTQNLIIIEYLKEHGDWVPSYKLRSVSTDWGFIGHQGDRRCRELAHDGKIEHKKEGRYAYYRAKTTGIIEELAKLKEKPQSISPQVSCRTQLYLQL